jgi:hypothetical protein
MTSSSDTGHWQPLLLLSTPLAESPGRPAFAPSLAPQGAVIGDAAAADFSAWLPSLRTTAETTAEQTRLVLVDQAFGEASRVERRRADARCATALQAVALAADHLEVIAAEFAQDRERDLQGLAMAVARHIVQHELSMDPLRIGELVRRALALLPLDHSIEVRLNPEDLDTLAPSLDGLRPQGREVHVRWVGDPCVERGGFIAESPHRIVDGRADVALRALYEKFDHD